MSGRLIQTCAVLWILLLGECKIPDVYVTCVFSKNCILPCNFTYSGDAVIKWYQQGALVHSFAEGEDQPDDSNVSLFQDQVSHGNASLNIRQCSIRDKGRYKCQVNSTGEVQESFVLVKVEAPIRTVTIETRPGEEVQCTSKGVYPAPLVQWSTEPRSPPDALRPLTRMSPDSEGLFSVESLLKTQGRSSHMTYICSVISKYGRQRWTASLLQAELTGEEGRDLTIPCAAPKNLQKFNLSWTFTRTSTPTNVLSYESQTHHISNSWGSRARLDQDQVLTGDGSLQLLKTKNSEDSGIYTCEFSGFQIRHLVQTQVNISALRTAPQEDDSNTGLWVIVVVVGLVAIVAAVVLVRRKYTGKSNSSRRTALDDTEMQPMQADNSHLYNIKDHT